MEFSPDRRTVLRGLAAAGAVIALPAPAPGAADDPPKTNIEEALKHPRTPQSLPGAHPARVVLVKDPNCFKGETPDPAAVARMVGQGVRELTGAANVRDAWRRFVAPKDIVGLKVNPIGGELLSTRVELVEAVIAQLEEAGLPKSNIVIFDRREFELHEAGFTAARFPGIRITGTEYKDESGSFFDADGKPLGLNRIDRDWKYWADCEETYDKETLPYMVNEGKDSYFSSIVTKDLTKIINIPVLKNAGSSVTLCLKNLAYGCITNTARLHKQLWSQTSAQVPCFPPLRDKTVLNIVDGLRGCWDGGPGADPKFITRFDMLLFGTDPVAVDRTGYDIILQRRLAEGVQRKESPRGAQFLQLAASYGLGEADPAVISTTTITL